MLMALVISIQTVMAQDVTPPQQTNPKGKSAQKIADKKEERKKEQEHTEDKLLKHQWKIQTKKTRKRMKKFEKKADKWNRKEGDSFFERLFKKKKKRN